MSLNLLHTDQDLLRRIAEGNEQAFAQLFYSFHQKLGAYILRLTKSTYLTEEIVQEVFVKVWLKREELIHIRDFDAYLFILCRNRAFNALRDEARKSAAHENWIQQLLPEQPGDAPEMQQEKWYALLEKAVAMLPAQQQKAYLLSRQEGMKHEEIAERLQLSRETVKRHISLALSSISRYIKENSDREMVLFMGILIKISDFS